MFDISNMFYAVIKIDIYVDHPNPTIYLYTNPEFTYPL